MSGGSKKLKRSRDSQVKKVYSWEEGIYTSRGVWWDTAKLISETDAKKLIRRAWKAYRPYAVPPVLTLGGRGVTKGRGSRHEIVIPRRDVYPEIVLHETAHSLLEHSASRSEPTAWHGPEFVRLLIELLARYCDGYSIATLKASARKAKVKYEDPNDLQQVLRRQDEPDR